MCCVVVCVEVSVSVCVCSGIGNVLCSTFSQTLIGQDQVVTSCEPLVQMNFSTWVIHGKQKNGDEGSTKHGVKMLMSMFMFCCDNFR